MAEAQWVTAKGLILGVRLKRLRESVGLSQDDVADRMGWSPAKQWRIEAGRNPPSWQDTQALVETLGGSSAQRAELVEQAKTVRQRGWWERHPDGISPGYASVEWEAMMRVYEAELVPALCQREPYARYVIEKLRPELPSEILETRLRARMDRRQVLDQERKEGDPPKLRAVVHEMAIRICATSDVGREQLQALLHDMEHPNIELSLLPVDAGVHGSSEGAFQIHSLPGIVLVSSEGLGGSLWVENVADVSQYEAAWNASFAAALGQAESAEFIRSVIA